MLTYEQKPQQSKPGQSDVPARPSVAAHTQAHPVRTLQRMIGNQSLQRLFQAQPDPLDAVSDAASPGRFGDAHRPTSMHAGVSTKKSTKIKPKLAVSNPGDIYEEEAERLSDHVLRMSDSLLQRACACGAACPKCQTKQPGTEHERVQVGRRATGETGPATAPPIVQEVLSAPGRPLDPYTRDLMEPRFGQDLSHVRIHTDRKAAESARAVNALAYTVGSNVVFGEGAYTPRTSEGRRLLAHELVHTMQQDESSEPAVVHRQSSLDIALGSPGVIAQVLGSDVLDGFKLNSHSLTAEHKRRLIILAENLKHLLQQHQLGTVVITGHTDATGDERLNKQLGQDRADAVADFLRKAGVRPIALLAISVGESELRVPTERAEPRNRRVEIRFDPELPTPVSEPETAQKREPETAQKPEEPVRIPRPEEFCTEYPEKCDEIAKREEIPDCGSTTDCSAVSTKPYNQQPAALRSLIERSVQVDPAWWFEGLPSDLGLALTSIFNRLCRYGLLCEVRAIVKIEAGEPPVRILDRLFNVPGLTPAVYFVGADVDAFPEKLINTGRFCRATGLGAALHPNGPTLREVSGSDSLHLSVEGTNQIEGHIDHYSPVPKHPGRYCPNTPTPAALGHIVREVVPEKLRKIMKDLLDVPGLRQVTQLVPEGLRELLTLPGTQLFPEPPPPAPVPPGAVGSEPVPELVRITLRGPVKEEQRRRPDVEPLPPDIEQRLADEIPKRIARNAMVPPSVERAAEEAATAAEFAGPDEEKALVAKREAARQRRESFAEDAHYFAQDLARRMDQARRTGRDAFVVMLGPIYGQLTPAETKYVLNQIRDIARIARALLAERAALVRKIWVVFGEGVMWEVDF